MSRLRGQLYARIALDYPDHPKIASLSDGAFRTHIEMILYSRKYELDGVIPENLVETKWVTGWVSELLTNGNPPSLTHDIDAGVYIIHGYADMQETKTEIAARRAVNRENGKKGGRPKTQSVTKRVTQKKPNGFLKQNRNETQMKAETETETDIEIPKGISLAQIAGAFERFWSIYPRKVGKKTARDKFTTAAKRADVETIIAGAERLANDPNLPESQFIPHPSTWLNRDGWDDDPLPARLPTRDKGEENFNILSDFVQRAAQRKAIS